MWSNNKCKVNIASGNIDNTLPRLDSQYIYWYRWKADGWTYFQYRDDITSATHNPIREKEKEEKVNFEWRSWNLEKRYSWNVLEWWKEEKRVRKLYYYRVNKCRNRKINHQSFLKSVFLSVLKTYIPLERNHSYPFSWILFSFSMFWPLELEKNFRDFWAMFFFRENIFRKFHF